MICLKLYGKLSTMVSLYPYCSHIFQSESLLIVLSFPVLTSFICVGLGEVLLMKGTSLGQEGALVPDEGNKRQRDPLNEPLKSKKTEVEEAMADSVDLTPEITGSHRVKGKGENNFSSVPEGGENLTDP